MSVCLDAVCPFIGHCDTNCMLFLTESDEVSGTVMEGDGHCSFALLASHIASEKHWGGNYLMKTISYREEVRR